MWESSWPVLIAGLGFGLGFVLAARRQASLSRTRSGRTYSYAVSAYRHRDWTLALSFASESIGQKPSHEGYNLLGSVWGQLERYEEAAQAFFDARHSVGYGPQITEGFSLRQEVCFYFTEESLAFARDRNWEFAFIRANDALSLIAEGRLVRYGEFGDYESWLRMTRLVAAVNHLKGEAAVRVAIEDAHWLLKHSSVSGYSLIADLVDSSASDPKLMRSKVTEEWLRYDLPRRKAGVIID